MKGNPNSRYYDGKISMLKIWKDKLTRSEFIGLCKGNILKYLIRNKGNNKDKLNDFIKAKNYIEYLIELQKEDVYETNNTKTTNNINKGE